MKKSIEEMERVNEIKPKTGSWIKMSEEENENKENISSMKCLKVAQRTIYFFVLFILTFILLVQIFNCFRQYVKEPTYLETKITPQHKALFPAMTICPVTSGYKEDVLKVVLIFTHIKYVLVIFRIVQHAILCAAVLDPKCTLIVY